MIPATEESQHRVLSSKTVRDALQWQCIIMVAAKPVSVGLVKPPTFALSPSSPYNLSFAYHSKVLVFQDFIFAHSVCQFTASAILSQSHSLTLTSRIPLSRAKMTPLRRCIRVIRVIIPTISSHEFVGTPSDTAGGHEPTAPPRESSVQGIDDLHDALPEASESPSSLTTSSSEFLQAPNDVPHKYEFTAPPISVPLAAAKAGWKRGHESIWQKHVDDSQYRIRLISQDMSHDTQTNAVTSRLTSIDVRIETQLVAAACRSDKSLPRVGWRPPRKAIGVQRQSLDYDRVPALHPMGIIKPTAPPISDLVASTAENEAAAANLRPTVVSAYELPISDPQPPKLTGRPSPNPIASSADENVAAAAKTADRVAFDYDAFQRRRGNEGNWVGQGAVYEWSRDYRDVAPQVLELENVLLGSEDIALRVREPENILFGIELMLMKAPTAPPSTTLRSLLSSGRPAKLAPIENVGSPPLIVHRCWPTPTRPAEYRTRRLQEAHEVEQIRDTRHELQE
ncbi:uncharacterized protein MYCFIDRAFT_179773 [Pseudocercospora fijiensis CIRAD86]|uniref:Uncharacterized protein n=1 Tax=Pseudocercospora fijiensis (strain CIRAD86) TaxID=383855 RepID=M2ZZD0_PSEFD|nr:uncharacterized protein MYCFIDRAFT_179773 [Pseudocercospora fijiensis CIRAD86]EME77521.1 hypothetical protein MYCFIDRAFT_179773 [Pseudocercospora fijiensis CIRAD86]